MKFLLDLLQRLQDARENEGATYSDNSTNDFSDGEVPIMEIQELQEVIATIINCLSKWQCTSASRHSTT